MKRLNKFFITATLSIALVFTGMFASVGFTYAETTTDPTTGGSEVVDPVEPTITTYEFTSSNVATIGSYLAKISTKGMKQSFSESGAKAFPAAGEATRTKLSNSTKAAKVIFYYAIFRDRAKTYRQRMNIQNALTYLHKGISAVPKAKRSLAKEMVAKAMKYPIPSYYNFKVYRYKLVDEYKGKQSTFIGYSTNLKKPCVALTYSNAYLRKAITINGGTSVVLPEVYTVEKAMKNLISGEIDALIVPGGKKVDPSTFGEKLKFGLSQGSRRRDKVDTAYLTAAFQLDMPVLTFCRGIHILNVFDRTQGGTLYQDFIKQKVTKVSHRHTTHYVTVYKNTLLSKLMGSGKFKVYSNHARSIKKLAKNAKVCAKSPDGIIEAIYFPKQTFALGLQFHPEKPVYRYKPSSAKIFSKYLEAATNFRAKMDAEKELEPQE